MPRSRTLSTIACAQRIARAGPSKVAKKPSPGGVELLPSEPRELARARSRGAARGDPPRAIAERGRALGRADDVGEEDGREDAVGDGTLLPAGKESLYLGRNLVVDPGGLSSPAELDRPRAGYQLAATRTRRVAPAGR